jgi:TonB family protein
MGYQALLFCPDEKTARTVTQVLSELDFAVTPCTEPFAAVKKLMAEHFDAVVVDCDNEQNATLLFKSARNTINNQSSLAVAVVEGQAGVAKAFRIGANLVLTKPINVEQAKGTLRVARGLLRKNEAAKPASAGGAATASAVSKPAPQSTIPKAIVPQEKAVSQPVSIPEIGNVGPETSAATAAETKLSVSGADEPKIAASQSTVSATTGFGSSVASAVAPARERKDVAAAESKPSAPSSEHESPTAKVAESSESAVSSDERSVPAPTFTFGGTVGSENESSGSGSKKALIAVAAVVLIAMGGYAAWTHWGSANTATSAPADVITQPSPAPAPTPKASTSSTSRAASASTSESQATASEENGKSHPSKISGEAGLSKPSAAVAENKVLAAKAAAENAAEEKAAEEKAAEEKAAEEPIVLKNASKPVGKSASLNDVQAPSMAPIAPVASGSMPPNLLDSTSNAPTPVLQTLNVSQGVSQGLLLKKVSPVYPPSALRLRTEGSVQLMATISKSGNISAVKILSGDAQLAHAAAEAVKQWKYKPYLLNGSPVEIQTQITVNFKLPN